MAQSLASVLVHFVFATKNRQPWITEEFQPDVAAYIAGLFRNHDCPTLIVNAMPDHVHSLAALARTRSISDIMEAVKGISSGWIKTEDPRFRAFQWPGGHGAFSVSPSQKEVVRRYIANQREHHRRFSFEEEYRRLLERNGVPYDERYLWS